MFHLATSVAVHCTAMCVPDDDVTLMQTQVRHRVSREFTEGEKSSDAPDTSEIVAALGAGASPEVASVLVEKLARSSVETNSSLDDDTKTALESLRAMLVDTEQANIQTNHVADQLFIDGEFSAIQGCGTSLTTDQGQDDVLQGQINTKRTTHSECRVALDLLKTTMETDCGALASFESTVTVPSCTTPGHDLMAQWFVTHREWVIPNEIAWTNHNAACEAAKTAYNEKDAACDLDQGQFETNFCVFREQVHGTCMAYENCFATALDNYASGQSDVQEREKGRKVDYTATEKIKCYIDVLLVDPAEGQDNRAAKLQECQLLCGSVGEINSCTDKFTITYHAMPDAQLCSRDAVASYPCVDDFINSEYSGLTDLRTCVECPDLPPHLTQPGYSTHSPWDWDAHAVTSECDSNPWDVGLELDGNDGTRNGCNFGYKLDLGEVRTIKETYIDWEACQCEAYGSVQLLSSVDGTTWLPYYNPSFHSWGGSLKKTYKTPVTAQYFKVQLTQPPALHSWLSMWEYRLTPMPSDAPVWPEIQVVLVSNEVLNVQTMQEKCSDGFGLVKLKSADHVRHLAVKFTEAGGDWMADCGAALATKTSHNPNRYATLGTQEADVTAFLQEVFDGQEFGGDLWTHQGAQDLVGFGWGSHGTDAWYSIQHANGAENRQIHDFGGHCSQAVFCEAV